MQKLESISRLTYLQILLLGSLLLILACKNKVPEPSAISNRKPNVILVMTDDQGIGDLGCHGNPWIKTPNIDQFYETSVRLTNFHVSPMCTPTRSALLTGLYPINNGVWATFKGRDVLHPSTLTMAEVFKENGYATGMFGKWHLGNNYPSRPMDRGFEEAIYHSSGGVGELSDYWGNNYFDDTYLVNGKPKPFEGYCTDIWFDEALRFIKEKKDEPFFVYLPTNAPHHPLYVADKYADPYRALVDKKIPSAEFYGMLTNIDDNFGKLEKALDAMGLAENTILIFCSDNGSQFGVSEDYSLGWNKGFRGRKGEKLEGGHRVPFFIRWPKAGIEGGKDVDQLAAHVDLLPTLSSLCGIQTPPNFNGDGLDLSSVITSDSKALENRTVYVHHRQDYRQPEPVRGSGILKGDWRLLNGTDLYNIKSDPEQLNNMAANHPEVVKELLHLNTEFIKNSIPRKEYQEFAYSEIAEGHQATLSIQHAIGEDGPIWKASQIAAGITNTNASYPVRFPKAGKYRISCMRWPQECPGPIQGIPIENPKNQFSYKNIAPEKARISLFGKTYEKTVGPEDHQVVFELDLEAGQTMLDSHFVEGSSIYGVYYTYVEQLSTSH